LTEKDLNYDFVVYSSILEGLVMWNFSTTRLALGSLAILSLLLAQPAVAQKTISAGGITFDETDYSATGIDIGQEGFWFANFDATTPVTGEPVDSNDENQLPSWVLPDFDPNSPDYSFGTDAGGVTSSGGHTPWNFLTLPDGTNGLSGSLVDPGAINNSNNTVKNIVLGPGTPSYFLMHVVVDNTNGEHNPANRIRGRAESDDGLFDEDFRYNTAPADFNGIADVYTFIYEGWDEDDFIKIQLNSGVDGIAPGFAGLLFDVPEPSGLSLVLLGLLTVSGLARNRRQT
jgi:hypothetical protein